MTEDPSEEDGLEGYPRQQKLQKLLSVLDRTITAAEQSDDPGGMIYVRRGHPDAMVQLSYFDREGLTERRVDLAGELGLGVGETISLLSLAHSSGYILRGHVGLGGGGIAQIDHLEHDGYVLIGELPEPQKRLELILDAAIQAVRQDKNLSQEDREKRIDWFEEAKFVVRTFGVEVAKAVWRGDLPPI